MTEVVEIYEYKSSWNFKKGIAYVLLWKIKDSSNDYTSFEVYLLKQELT